MAAWEFQTLQNIAEKHGWHKFISMQNYYNLLYREEGMCSRRKVDLCLFLFPVTELKFDLEREMIPYCRDSGVGLIPWSPIARGALSRPFDSRSNVREKSDRLLNVMIRGGETETDKKVIDRVEELAKKESR